LSENNEFNEWGNPVFAYYSYHEKTKIKGVIFIQPISHELNIHKFKCLLEHEYGHHLEFMKKHKDLNEEFADDYMQSVYPVCERFYE